MTNLKPVDVAIVGGRWSGLAMANEITTRSGLNVVVLEKKLRPDMQLLSVEGATQGRPGDQRGN
jgi:2-polyprenyl-6-methoxyphenol hydroxylase-like FAD-dependent oxidoreductase